LDQSGFTEGDGWGFDRLLKSAMLQRRWAADAEADQVLEWFLERLTARSWELHSNQRASEEAPLAAAFYRRGSAGFVVVVRGRAADRPASSMYWPSAWLADEGLQYDVSFDDISPKDSRTADGVHVDRADRARTRHAGDASSGVHEPEGPRVLMRRRDRADDQWMTRSLDAALRRGAFATGLALATLTVLWLVSALAMASLIPGHWGDVARIALASLVSGTTSAVLIRRGRRPRASGEMRSA
jgi:hypothetical protein